jgi:ABC-type dipeptide/oligopeptide/nickel transport system permease subunit
MRSRLPLVPRIGQEAYDLGVARVAQATFVTIGLTFLVGYGIGYLTGFHGPLWDTAGVALYVVAALALPFISLATVVWLAVDFVRRFRRCRATRLA